MESEGVCMEDDGRNDEQASSQVSIAVDACYVYSVFVECVYILISTVFIEDFCTHLNYSTLFHIKICTHLVYIIYYCCSYSTEKQDRIRHARPVWNWPPQSRLLSRWVRTCPSRLLCGALLPACPV